HTAGHPLDAKHSMEGLDPANHLLPAPTREKLIERVRAEQSVLAAAVPAPQTPAPAEPLPPARVYLARVEPPAPPDLELHVLRDVPLSHVYPYLNLQMLYGKHLGLRGLVSRLLADGDSKALELHAV